MSDLKRFIDAQADNYADALEEIKRGQKRSCWMWYVFPQIKGLGFSSMSKLYAIQSLQEAKEYLQDPILGSRLLEICEAALNVESNIPEKVFGCPDNLKLQSSMTLFEMAQPENPIFGKILEKYFDGQRDNRTIQIIMEMEENK